MEDNEEEYIQNIAEMAENILKEELINFGFDEGIASIRIPGLKTVGVAGDMRKYSYYAEIEVNLEHRGRVYDAPGLIDKISNRITNEVDDISRVAYIIGSRD